MFKIKKLLITYWRRLLVVIVIIGAIITVGLLSHHQNTRLITNCIPAIPDDIDIVLIDQHRGRCLSQVKLIRKHLHWIRNIYILYTDEEPSIEDCFNVQVDGRLELSQMVKTGIISATPAIADNFIYLGDTTIPLRSFRKTDLFGYQGQRRIFNHGHESDIFNDYYETVLPLVLMQREKLESAIYDWNYCIFQQTLKHQLVFNTTLHKQVTVSDNSPPTPDDHKKCRIQLQPLWATYSIPPHLCDQDLANIWIKNHFDELSRSKDRVADETPVAG